MLSPIAFVNLIAETSIVLALVLILSHACAPHLRVLLFRCAFVIALLAPIALIGANSRPALATLPMDALVTEFVQPASLEFGQEEEGGAAAATAPVAIPPLFLVLGLWLAGAFFVVSRHFLSLRRLSRAFAEGSAPSPAATVRIGMLHERLGVAKPVAVRFSRVLNAPCMFGWRNAKVIVPAHIDGEALDAVLAHELCHARNGDALWVAAGNFACALYWFNPLVWLCARGHRAGIEFICDDEAARVSVGVKNYARSIVEVARTLVGKPALAGAMMSGHGIATRMRSLITREEPMKAVTRTARGAAYALSAAAVVSLGSVQLVAAENIRHQPPSAGNGYIYLKVAPKIEVAIEEIGAWCGDDANCVFEAPLGAELRLVATLNRSGAAAWTGCEPSEDGSACFATISETPVRVKVKAR